MTKHYDIDGVGSSIEIGPKGPQISSDGNTLEIGATLVNIDDNLAVAGTSTFNDIAAFVGIDINGLELNTIGSPPTLTIGNVPSYAFNNDSLANYTANNGISLTTTSAAVDITAVNGVDMNVGASSTFNIAQDGMRFVEGINGGTFDFDHTFNGLSIDFSSVAATRNIELVGGNSGGYVQLKAGDTSDIIFDIISGGEVRTTVQTANMNSGIPTDLAVATKKYVDDNVASSITYKGGYNAVTNTPDLDILSSPATIIEIGDMYVVTDGGTFFTVIVEPGDTLIATIDNAAIVTDWTIVQTNLTAASIKSSYESNANTNAFTDDEQTRVASFTTYLSSPSFDLNDAALLSAANTWSGIQTFETVANVRPLTSSTDAGFAIQDETLAVKARMWIDNPSKNVNLQLFGVSNTIEMISSSSNANSITCSGGDFNIANTHPNTNITVTSDGSGDVRLHAGSSGEVIVLRDPTVSLGVATKQYVDNLTGSNTGVSTGCKVSVNGGDNTTIDISAGEYEIAGVRYIYAGSSAVDPVFDISEDTAFVYLDATGLQFRNTTGDLAEWTPTQRYTQATLARLTAAAPLNSPPGLNVIRYIRDDRWITDERHNIERMFQVEAVGNVYATGGTLVESSTAFQLNQISGILYDIEQYRHILGSLSDIGGIKIIASGTPGISPAASFVVPLTYDNGAGGETALSPNKYASHTIMKSPKGPDDDGVEGGFFMVISSTEHNSLAAAQTTALEFGPFSTAQVVPVARIIVKASESNITEIIDERPIIGTSTSLTSTSYTLQDTYNFSNTPEITTEVTRGALTIEGGTGTDTHNNLEINNNAGTTTATIQADGTADFSALTIASDVVATELYVDATSVTSDLGSFTGDIITPIGSPPITTTKTALQDLETKVELVEKPISNSQTGTAYTVVASDLGKPLILTNASAITLSIPVGLGADFHFSVIQKGVGLITFSAELSSPAISLFNVDSHTQTRGTDSIVSFFATAADDFVFAGATQ